ncbi:hypothetical protein GQ53DRAFT_757386 [Thozetella sp. PMI_491]|nr:hypothetical protein GQ53DRAFT_757386 [Thozetella sp. PMI_491]
MLVFQKLRLLLGAPILTIFEPLSTGDRVMPLPAHPSLVTTIKDNQDRRKSRPITGGVLAENPGAAYDCYCRVQDAPHALGNLGSISYTPRFPRTPWPMTASCAENPGPA